MLLKNMRMNLCSTSDQRDMKCMMKNHCKNKSLRSNRNMKLKRRKSTALLNRNSTTIRSDMSRHYNQSTMMNLCSTSDQRDMMCMMKHHCKNMSPRSNRNMKSNRRKSTAPPGSNNMMYRSDMSRRCSSNNNRR